MGREPPLTSGPPQSGRRLLALPCSPCGVVLQNGRQAALPCMRRSFPASCHAPGLQPALTPDTDAKPTNRKAPCDTKVCAPPSRSIQQRNLTGKRARENVVRAQKAPLRRVGRRLWDTDVTGASKAAAPHDFVAREGRRPPNARYRALRSCRSRAHVRVPYLGEARAACLVTRIERGAWGVRSRNIGNLTEHLPLCTVTGVNLLAVPPRYRARSNHLR